MASDGVSMSVRFVRATAPSRLMALLLSLVAMAAAARPDLLEQGQKLFTGKVALVGRMVGHTQALPLEAVRCTNCHQREADRPLPPSTQDFGPKLGPAGLTRALPRRGGPASAYDAGSFCRLLRDGIDPAHVMIPQTMPRYTMSDGECEALWLYLTTP
jgi:hypothetical protein